nr:RecName: Full=Cysteine-rich venom protein 23; AltName: Full=CRVP-23h [Naja haje haje]
DSSNLPPNQKQIVD